MRLIDADRFLRYMEEKCDPKAQLDPIILAIVREALNEQPTAYDIDKVVEELETNKQNALEVEESIKEYNVWNEAIEIVRQGGVSDDVCEWEHRPTDNNVIRPFHHKDVIGMYEDVLCKFPYCPVCGKKIKVVERMNKAFEKIIDELKQESIIVDDDAGHRAVEIIEQMAKEYNGGWIACSERLPEEAFGCLVTVMDCEPSTQTDFENILPYFVGYDGSSWNDADGNVIPFEVVAWQPLPAPFREIEVNSNDD